MNYPDPILLGPNIIGNIVCLHGQRATGKTMFIKKFIDAYRFSVDDIYVYTTFTEEYSPSYNVHIYKANCTVRESKDLDEIYQNYISGTYGNKDRVVIFIFDEVSFDCDHSLFYVLNLKKFKSRITFIYTEQYRIPIKLKAKTDLVVEFGKKIELY